jgi:hypothetical protein
VNRGFKKPLGVFHSVKKLRVGVCLKCWWKTPEEPLFIRVKIHTGGSDSYSWAPFTAYSLLNVREYALIRRSNVRYSTTTMYLTIITHIVSRRGGLLRKARRKACIYSPKAWIRREYDAQWWYFVNFHPCDNLRHKTCQTVGYDIT